MATPAVAQINVRLDRELKEAGDRQLELAGYTPSQAVRALWGKLARGGEDARKALAGTFGGEANSDSSQALSPEAERKLAALERMDRSWELFAQKLDLDLSTLSPLTDEELEEMRYEALMEKYGE